MIASRVVASAYLIFLRLLNLLVLLGCSSTSKNIELLALGHEVAVLRTTNPRPLYRSRLGYPLAPSAVWLIHEYAHAA
jgi:hypothetical protein